MLANPPEMQRSMKPNAVQATHSELRMVQLRNLFQPDRTGSTTRPSIGTISRMLKNQLRRVAPGKVCIWIRRRWDVRVKQARKESCCLCAVYPTVWVSEGGFIILARFKVKERLFGLR